MHGKMYRVTFTQLLTSFSSSFRPRHSPPVLPPPQGSCGIRGTRRSGRADTSACNGTLRKWASSVGTSDATTRTARWTRKVVEKAVRTSAYACGVSSTTRSTLALVSRLAVCGEAAQMIATVHYGLRGGLCGVGVSPRSDLSSRHHTITQYICF